MTNLTMPSRAVVAVSLLTGERVSCHRVGRTAEQQDPEGELLLRIRSGDERAVRVLWDRMEQPMLALARHLARGDGDRAEDGRQAGFIRAAVTKIDQFDPSTGSGRSFVLRCVAVEVKNLGRRAYVRREVVASSDEHEFILFGSRPSPAPTPAAELELAELTALISTMVESLPPLERDAVAGRFEDGLNMEDLASALGVRLSDAREALSRGLGRLGAVVRGFDLAGGGV